MMEAVLHINQRVRVSVKGARVVITPVYDARFTLEQRVAAYAPKRHGGEQMATTQTLGAERC